MRYQHNKSTAVFPVFFTSFHVKDNIDVKGFFIYRMSCKLLVIS